MVPSTLPLTSVGNLIQKDPNFVMGSKLPDYMEEEVNMGWGHVKVLLGQEVKYIFANLFCSFSFKGRRNKWFKSCWNQKHLSTILWCSWENLFIESLRKKSNKIFSEEFILIKFQVHLPPRQSSPPGYSFTCHAKQLPKFPPLDKPAKALMCLLS